eukprot:3941894-Rhodomonas_salina.1
MCDRTTFSTYTSSVRGYGMLLRGASVLGDGTFLYGTTARFCTEHRHAFVPGRVHEAAVAVAEDAA